MKKLLATSAIAIVALSGAASAQSVLERVLGQIDNATNLASVNGTFANIAENIGSATAVNTYEAVTATSDSGPNLAANASQAQFDAWLAATTVANTYAASDTSLYYYNPATGIVVDQVAWENMTTGDRAGFSTVADGNTLIENADGSFDVIASTGLAADLDARAADILSAEAGVTTSYTGPAEGIDGSITNIVDGIDQATQEAVASAGVSATEWNMPTLDFGDMATTALGAVNTGDITLGVNSAIDEASTSTTNALSSVMNQIGGSADTGAIVINVASNMTGVNGSITNTMNEVNGSIGNLATTALGAVNTGTIVSGIDGVITGITGSSSGQQTQP